MAARNSSAQENNLVRKVNDFMKRMGVSPVGQIGPTNTANIGNGVTIKFSNNMGNTPTELNDIVVFKANPEGDNSAADIIAIRSDGKEFGISCKQHNPGSFCGAGLKSFAGTGPDGDIVMRRWMDSVLGKVAAYYLNIMTKRMDKLGDKIVLEIQKNGNQPLSATKKREFEKEFKEAYGNMPQLYIPIPRGMRFQLLRGDGHSGKTRASHYITGGTAAAAPQEDPKYKTITFTDCQFYTLDEMAQKHGNNLFIVIRKRRAADYLQLFSSSSSHSPIKTSQGFLKIFTGGGRRIQVREHMQLPTKLTLASLISDNSGEQATIRTTPAALTSRTKSQADILEVPVPLNPVATAKYNR